MNDRVNDYLVEQMKMLREDYTMTREVFLERNQMYGSLIRMLLSMDITEISISYNDLSDANRYTLKYTPDDEAKTLKLELIPNPDYKEKHE